MRDVVMIARVASRVVTHRLERANATVMRRAMMNARDG